MVNVSGGFREYVGVRRECRELGRWWDGLVIVGKVDGSGAIMGSLARIGRI